MRKMEMTELRYVEAGTTTSRLFGLIEYDNTFLQIRIPSGYIKFTQDNGFPVIEYNVKENASAPRDVTLNFYQIAKFISAWIGVQKPPQ